MRCTVFPQRHIEPGAMTVNVYRGHHIRRAGHDHPVAQQNSAPVGMPLLVGSAEEHRVTAARVFPIRADGDAQCTVAIFVDLPFARVFHFDAEKRLQGLVAVEALFMPEHGIAATPPAQK